MSISKTPMHCVCCLSVLKGKEDRSKNISFFYFQFTILKAIRLLVYILNHRTSVIHQTHIIEYPLWWERTRRAEIIGTHWRRSHWLAELSTRRPKYWRCHHWALRSSYMHSLRKQSQPNRKEDSQLDLTNTTWACKCS